MFCIIDFIFVLKSNINVDYIKSKTKKLTWPIFKKIIYNFSHLCLENYYINKITSEEVFVYIKYPMKEKKIISKNYK